MHHSTISKTTCNAIPAGYPCISLVYQGDTQLSDKARSLIENTDHGRYVSIASFWEMAIIASLSKLELDMSFKDLFKETDKNGFDLLPITTTHTEKIIPLDLNHRDPFDRMLICQAMAEKLTIITADSQFQNYKVKQVW